MISGYLITSLLLREFENGKFSAEAFWERRLRRIFPACAAMVLITLLAGAFLPSSLDFAELGESSIAQSLMGSNLFFWRKPDGYFAASGVEPLLHTWSLAIEEQFYLFFPLVLLVLSGVVQRRPVLLRALLWGGFVLSLVAAVILLPTDDRSVFYLLPTRAWELLTGALLAGLPVAWMLRNRVLREVVVWLGLAGILLPVWLYSKFTAFPGLAALAPCLGAGAVIWADMRLSQVGPDNSLTFLGRVLAWRPLVFIGLISYSLYLWHWPVLVFTHYGWSEITALPLIDRLTPVVGSFVLAIMSWRWIELPFRNKRVADTRPKIFGLAVAVTVVVMALGAIVAGFKGFPSRFSKDVAAIEAASVPSEMIALKTEAVSAGKIPRFGERRRGAPVKVMLWGDSHAWGILPAMDAICKAKGIAGEAVTYGGTPPLLGAILPNTGYGEQAGPWSEAVLKHIVDSKITDVVLAGRWENYQQTAPLLFAKALPETIRRLNSTGCRVWVVLDIPSIAADPFRMRLREAVWGVGKDWRPTLEAHQRQTALMSEIAAQGLPAVFIDPAPVLIDPQPARAGSGVGKRYVVQVDGVSLYQDTHHITTAGALTVLLPILRQSMAEKLGQPVELPAHNLRKGGSLSAR